ncbi:MAG TPA: hypothetical protein P5279_08740 [Anaerohalosphaeraceae bacterium]|jgi:capsular polysaccharide biosynthesis protein|nr:hypothetical protein [Anaerohalosphaeraceae bacterium]HRT50565.1 hypothetical protein [Anaerohalosphaeraceae bacterium]HRT86495.1 hypothetical protein [Anaerohalosphaeraceae bacterium]
MGLRIVRHWCVIPLTALFVCAVAIPIVLLWTTPEYETTGRVRVQPVLSRADWTRDLYDTYRNSEAVRIATRKVLDAAAGELHSKNPDGATVSATDLQTMITRGILTIKAERDAEFIALKMITRQSRDAEEVINTIMDSYMKIVDAENDVSGDRTLTVLDEQKRKLETKTALLKQEIDRLQAGTDGTMMPEVMAEVDKFSNAETPGETMRDQQDQREQDRMARRLLALDQKEAELERTKTLYNQIRDRMTEIETGLKSPVRVSIAQKAVSIPLKSNRSHLIVATIIFGIMLGAIGSVVKANQRNPGGCNA